MAVWSASHWKQLSALCAGFILATVWFDLMFDTRIKDCCGADCEAGELEQGMSVVAAYYKQTTMDAFPMGFLLGFVMILGIVASYESWKRSHYLKYFMPLSLCGVAIIATAFGFPECMALGHSGGSPALLDRACHVLFLHQMQVGILIVHIMVLFFGVRPSKGLRRD
mmetsp:Transcript_27566/g.77019  ORF Transcript_27566/g.77019 Transcript_27566/m.77019 type:complete len:167 (+) Transcript_27566:123-623(+)|eukprot:CAMPEP_0119118688 /NCGR_PEP_ID=MMETSP1310-20130426/488_1 /TAXON_ID=464262 /ORGANISM="Genus nov. species nov., Strain RCC2339" /LENGTH=166 /DNA_ID=CAMNT_0007108075 /DNA_START=60 /DNA_END=560 /DNA_ORIENTATION=-